MFVAGLLLILLGALAILAAVFGSDGTASFLDQDISALAIFLIGLGSGVAILWGLSLTRFGVRRSLRHRRESKQLEELSDKLDKVDEDKRRDVDDDRI